MLLDFHTHFDTTDPDALKTFVAKCQEYDTRVCMCTVGPRSDHEYIDNETLLKSVSQYSEFITPFAFVDLWDTVDVDCVDRYYEQGFRGLKLISPYYEYDHDLYMPIYERAQALAMPTLFHTGLFRPNKKDAVTRRPVIKNMRPLCLDRIARSFPDLIVVMAHMGTALFRHEGAELIKEHPNMYADLAGCGNFMAVMPHELAELLRHPIFIQDKDYSGFKKLIFGSDAYVSIPEIISNANNWYSRSLERNGVPSDIVDLIMGKTAGSWLGI